MLLQKNTEAFNRLSTAEIKEKIIKKLVARIEIDTNSVEVQFFAGKSYFRGESKGIDSRLASQVAVFGENQKNNGSRTCQNGAQNWIG